MTDSIVITRVAGLPDRGDEFVVTNAPSFTTISYGFLADPGAFLGGPLSLDALGHLVVGTDASAVTYRPLGFSEDGVELERVR